MSILPFSIWPIARRSMPKGSAGRRMRMCRVASNRIEVLEGRRMLSATLYGTAAQIGQPLGVGEAIGEPIVEGASSGSPVGLTPDQLRNAYGIASLRAINGVAADGSGQTIAIVMYNSDPNIFNDVDQFDAQYNITVSGASENLYLKYGSAGGSNGFLTVVNQNGQASPLPAASYDAAIEISLDVEMAHAIAPGAKIVLVEANSGSLNQNDEPIDLLTAVDTARNWPGVSVVSMSWGVFNNVTQKSMEYPYETHDDSHFTTPAGHTGVAFLASSGDFGSPASYPAYSPNVVAVGGTNLSTDTLGHYLGETAWSGSGGGQSAYEPEPTYQQAVQSSNQREVPDVSFDAGTGVSIYDSYQSGSPPPPPWSAQRGTSIGAPAWAGLTAIIDQARLSQGLQTVDGSTQLLNALYSAMPEGDYHDVTSGSNGGYNAGSGYDEVTGLGTPNAAAYVNALTKACVTLNLAGYPSGEVINVSSSGGVTYVSASGGTGFAAASSAIGSLNILGTSNNSLTVDYSGGNPVPNGTIFYNGGDGSNSLSVKADASFTLGNSTVSLSPNGSGLIATANVAAGTVTTLNDYFYPAHTVTMNGWYGAATANLLSSDSATLDAPSGSSGNTFTASPTSATLAGSGYTYSTNNGSSITAYAGSLSDGATLSSSAGQSGNFFAKAKGSATTGPYGDFGGTGWVEVASGFGTVTGISNNSADMAYLDDQYYTGAGATFIARAKGSATTGPYSAFGGTGWLSVASGFEKQVEGISYNSADIAYLNDQYYTGTGATFTAHATQGFNGGPYAAFSGNGWLSVANGFTKAINGQSYNSADIAYLDDEGSSGAVFSNPATSTFEGAGWQNTANGFHTVNMTSYNSSDVANLTDEGNNGRFTWYPTYAYIAGAGYDNTAYNFRIVQATSYYPSADVADIHDTLGGASVAVGSSPYLQEPNGQLVNFTSYAAINVYNDSQSLDMYSSGAAAEGNIYFFGNWAEA